MTEGPIRGLSGGLHSPHFLTPLLHSPVWLCAPGEMQSSHRGSCPSPTQLQGPFCPLWFLSAHTLFSLSPLSEWSEQSSSRPISDSPSKALPVSDVLFQTLRPFWTLHVPLACLGKAFPRPQRQLAGGPLLQGLRAAVPMAGTTSFQDSGWS